MTITVPELNARIDYSGAQGCTVWVGYVVEDKSAFRQFLAGPVHERGADAEFNNAWEKEIKALDSTGMSSTFLEDFLGASVEEKSWEIGEALAETVLATDAERTVVWPWNEARDRKTPRASLPGADLVGFVEDHLGVKLILGEVKTSYDAKTPPSVMSGRTGMGWQLADTAASLTILKTLFKWLRARCLSDVLLVMYHQALKRFLTSDGKDLAIVGVLLRDTVPDERDIKGRATFLAGMLATPTQVELSAWYLPEKIVDWPEISRGML
ncbi:hypothetical protein EA187_09240 [Lujinxingia sediminis]|uniref:Uncharacterized protein n=1 Tax=Lujinxingia sediminis TaxID=2480984 RepID=A0ABY0CSY7_9DELT|nr:hypothetical protein [Lujinxingia sediminis]RVU44717.1 hypothetical protein EA187_09240 [Lujinxingia sediminis]